MTQMWLITANSFWGIPVFNLSPSADYSMSQKRQKVGKPNEWKSSNVLIHQIIVRSWKVCFFAFRKVNQGSKNHFRRSENANRESKTHFRRSENADRGSKTHFRCSENANRESKTHFRHSENANRGSKNHFRRSGYRFQMSKISKLCHCIQPTR